MVKSERAKLRRVLERLGVPFSDGRFEDSMNNARWEYTALSPDEAYAINCAAKLLNEAERKKTKKRWRKAV